MAESSRRMDIDPLVSFAFSVSIEGINVARFNGVDGLAYEVEMIEYRDSANPNVVKYRQGRRKAGRVTLKRGVLVGSSQVNELLGWIREIESGKAMTPRNVSVEIGSYGIDKGVSESSNDKARAWQLLGCRPVKWSLGALDSNSNGSLIESIELVVEESRQD